MTHDTDHGYVLLARPAIFDRRALVQTRAAQHLPFGVQMQLNAIERRQRLRGELLNPLLRYGQNPSRRRPPS
ncbi:MAG: hypothetical protein SGJ19_14020 [Planctomycetia bacterium]|mgnify:CR=1 FL=1|nr:hypothetical protein [Planctomycetia bacterium]